MFISKSGIKFSVGFPFVAVAAFFFAAGMAENYLCCILFSFLHEVGHLIPMLLSGCSVKEISFGATGISIIKNNVSLSYKTECVIALCGPAVNLISVLIFYSLKDTGSFFLLAFNINIGLTVINLLPVRMLDGGRFAENLLNIFTDETSVRDIMQKAEMITVLFLVAVLIFVLITGIINTSFIFFVSALVIIIVFGVVRG